MDFRLIPVSRDSSEWQCSILKLGGMSLLLNCGWCESFDTKLLAPLVPHLNDLDLIVLTHADMKHLGAVPYLLTKYPITCPVVCTEPVCRLGELSCVSFLEDREKYRAPVDCFEVDDVLRIFMSRVRPVNYREPFQVQARGRTLVASPHPAGSHLGSAYWTLHCGGHSVVYLVDGSMHRGRFLDGLELQRLLPPCRGAAQRWDALITCPSPAVGSALPRRGVSQTPRQPSAVSKALKVAATVREQLFLEETITTLRKGGSVLIPADVSGWIPEVLLLLEAAWAQDRQLATNYPLVWLSSMGDMVLDQVKTRLEYMSKEVLASFETRFGQNPFVLKNLQVFQTLEELCASHPLSRSKVILATSPHLEGGDSRELLMRLCSEPRTLLWILGVPPTKTLAYSLLDDFIVKHHSRRDYRIQQHLKQALPDEQLRVYYEAKLQELSDTGQKLSLSLVPTEPATVKAEEDPPPPPPPPPHHRAASKAGGALEATRRTDHDDGDDDGKVKAEQPPSADASGFPAISENKASTASLPMKEKGCATAVLWSPLGWPASRTLAHSESRSEGDEYGHLLTAAELKAWRAQDQEGNKCAVVPTGLGVGPLVEGTEADRVKEDEGAKLEDDLPPPAFDAFLDWRDSLRVHFREPMHCEVRERTIRVACRVQFLPNGTLESQDLIALITMIAPKHVVLLPSAGNDTTGSVIAKHFSYSKSAAPCGGAVVPEIHALGADDASLHLSLLSLKRKAQFLPELWPKLSFLKIADGMRIARVRAFPSSPREGLDMRVLELGSCSAASGLHSLNGGDAGDDAQERERLPREGALFVGLSQDPLTLSSLKEQLRAAESEREELDVDFHVPGVHLARSWSHRVLTAGGKATLGWTTGERQAVHRDRSSLGRGVEVNTGVPVLRLEGMPGEAFFLARSALYRHSALI